MKTIKIIELLNRIANGEEVPKKIKYIDDLFKYDEDTCDYKLINSEKNYLFDYLENTCGGLTANLNDEVEIIDEPKKIEKIEYYDDSIAWVIDGAGQLSDIDKIAIDKINEIIDYLESRTNE